MGLFDWSSRQARHFQKIKDEQVALWTEAIHLERDLVCRTCYDHGSFWVPTLYPIMVVVGRTKNKVVMICHCGAALTFEEGLVLKNLHNELTQCFPLET